MFAGFLEKLMTEIYIIFQMSIYFCANIANISTWQSVDELTLTSKFLKSLWRNLWISSTFVPNPGFLYNPNWSLGWRICLKIACLSVMNHKLLFSEFHENKFVKNVKWYWIQIYWNSYIFFLYTICSFSFN